MGQELLHTKKPDSRLLLHTSNFNMTLRPDRIFFQVLTHSYNTNPESDQPPLYQLITFLRFRLGLCPSEPFVPPGIGSPSSLFRTKFTSFLPDFYLVRENNHMPDLNVKITVVVSYWVNKIFRPQKSTEPIGHSLYRKDPSVGTM